jgi:hypothetical protein
MQSLNFVGQHRLLARQVQEVPVHNCVAAGHSMNPNGESTAEVPVGWETAVDLGYLVPVYITEGVTITTSMQLQVLLLIS